MEQALVGRKVRNAARPEWGVGTVLRVQPTKVGGAPVHRVSVQFAVGHRTLLVPPARLVAPEPEQQRDDGWLDQIAGATLDDQLLNLPTSVTELLGTPRDRLSAVFGLYEYTEDPASLLKWARAQTQVADPLTHWSRDELLTAFRAFCRERDAHFRVMAALLVKAEGKDALKAALDALPSHVRSSLDAALARPL